MRPACTLLMTSTPAQERHMVTNPWGLPPRIAHIPRSLREWPHWVVWSASEKANGGVDKTPRQPKAPRYGASVSNPEHWTSFDNAVAALTRYPDRLSGVGFVMTNTQGLFAIDIDGADINDDVVVEAAALGTYMERSPSGRGFRLFGFGDLPGPSYLNKTAGVEVYDGSSPRYLTVTGHTVWPDLDQLLHVRQDLLDAFYAKYRAVSLVVDAAVGEHPPPGSAEDCEHMRDCLDELVPTRCWSFWKEGTVSASFASRSEVCMALFAALAAGKAPPEDVFQGSLANEHVMQRYLDARQGDYDRALTLLWQDISKASAYSEEAALGAPTPPDAFPELEDEDAPPSKPKQRMLVAACDMADPAPPQWTIKRYLERGSLNILFGEPSTGKSFVAIDWALAVARGEAWQGCKVRRGSVVYVAGEGYKGIGRRLQAAALEQGFALAELRNLLVSRVSVPMLDGQAVRKLIDELVEWHAELGVIELIVIDTLRRNFGPGDENSAKDVGAFVQACALLAQVTGAAVLVVHHSGHGDSNRERGSSVLIGDFDGRFQLRHHNGARELVPLKMKDALLPPKRSFSLHQVDLGYVDDEGDAITSAVPVWSTSEPDPLLEDPAPVVREEALNRGPRLMLQALMDLEDTQYMAAPPDARLKGARRVVEVALWRQTSLDRGLDRSSNRSNARQTWARSKRELLDAELIAFTDDSAFAWATDEGRRRMGDPLFN